MSSFQAVLELGGKTATGIRVPSDAVAALGKGKRVPVVVTFAGGYSYRTTVAPYGGDFFIPLSAENRTAAGLKAGDEVEVSLALDTEERIVDVPPELIAALDGDARERFDRLSYTRRKEMARTIREAKADDTRARRLAKILEELSS